MFPLKAILPFSTGFIQRCLNAARNEYEDWPGYSEELMTRTTMLKALKECEERWAEHAFSGHNVVNQKPGSDVLRPVR